MGLIPVLFSVGIVLLLLSVIFFLLVKPEMAEAATKRRHKKLEYYAERSRRERRVQENEIACFKKQETKRKLMESVNWYLSPQNHYWVDDRCRNQLKAEMNSLSLAVGEEDVQRSSFQLNGTLQRALDSEKIVYIEA